MRRNARLAAFLFGILLILLGLVITLQDLHSRRVQHGIAVGETIDLLFPSNSPPGVAAMTALVYVTAPRKIRVGQSAPVSINVSTPQSRRPSFRLSAAGLDVEPNDWVPLHAVSEYDLIALWSIRGTSPGSYPIVVNAKIDQQSNDAETLVVRFIPSDNLTVSVVRGSEDYFKMLAGPLATFGGGLLTLPGILAFYKNWKRERVNRVGRE